MAQTDQLLPQLEELSDRSKKRKGVKAFLCVYNELNRLSELLGYYRKLGVTEFYAVDNNSDDGSTEFLLGQEDVHLFHTTQSYRESFAGRIWTSNLCNVYGVDSWCLTIDTDEFLVYPYSENIKLPLLCEYLEHRHFEGLFCLMHDYYNNGPLVEAEYKDGTSIFDVCDHFDTPSSYRVSPTKLFPHIQVNGGPRPRKFWVSKRGPAMKKLPLVFWRQGFKYNHSTHSCSPIRLADVTGSLVHFKFLSNFKSFVANEIVREDRMNDSADYKRYLIGLKRRSFGFFNKRLSRKHRNSEGLLECGALSCSDEYFDFCFNLLCRRESYEVYNPIRIACRDARAARAKPVKYDALMEVWPLLVNMLNGLNTGQERAQTVVDTASDGRLRTQLESQNHALEILSLHVKRQADSLEELKGQTSSQKKQIRKLQAQLKRARKSAQAKTPE